MTQNNSSILSDVSTCLRDAMDTMFNTGISEDKNINFNGSLSAETLKLMNKRKLASAIVTTDEEQQNQGIQFESTKRLCTTNDHQTHEQK